MINQCQGASQYSQIVSYTTKPGRPYPPPKPSTKGKIRSNSFKVIWNVPVDNGGSPVTLYHLQLDDGGGWVARFSGDSLEHQCDQLSPGTQYRLRVAAESAGGVSDFSETLFVTTEPVVPGPPHPPVLREKPLANCLHLGWAAPDHDGGAAITEYEIDMTSLDNTTMSVYRGKELECVVASLLPGRPYLFQVRAQNRAGAGAWSSPLEVISGAGAPDRPKEPRAVAGRCGQVATVTWDSPINNGAIITGYKLELAQVSHTPEIVDSDSEDEEVVEEAEEIIEEEDDKSVYSDEEASDVSDIEDAAATAEPEKNDNAICDNAIVDVEDDEEGDDQSVAPVELVWVLAYAGSANTTQLTRLTPATQYQLRLAAVNAAGVSDYSCNVSMTMPASAPAQPRNVVLTSATSSSLSVKWKRGADHGEPVTGYTVEWSDQERKDAVTESQAVERRRVHLGDLRPDTSYHVRVAQVNSVGRGEWSAWLRVRTLPLPPAPPKLECQATSHNTLKLRWGDKTSLSHSYVLESESSGRRQWQQIYSGNNHSYRVNRLTENTEYRFRVSAISEAGQGPFSGVFSFRTSFAPPPPVKGSPAVRNITDTGFLVTWSSLKNTVSSGGDLLQYRVQVTRVRDQNRHTYEAGTSTELGVSGLDSKSDYTVRVAGVRSVTSEGEDVSMLGAYSPPTQVTTQGKSSVAGGAVASVVKETGAVRSGQQTRAWTDQQWAVVILCGFTLFAVFIAMIIQQALSWGRVIS